MWLTLKTIIQRPALTHCFVVHNVQYGQSTRPRFSPCSSAIFYRMRHATDCGAADEQRHFGRWQGRAGSCKNISPHRWDVGASVENAIQYKGYYVRQTSRRWAYQNVGVILWCAFENCYVKSGAAHWYCSTANLAPTANDFERAPHAKSQAIVPLTANEEKRCLLAATRSVQTTVSHLCQKRTRVSCIADTVVTQTSHWPTTPCRRKELRPGVRRAP